MISYMEELVENTDLSKNKPLRDVVYESLKKIIIEGKIPVGERIIEKEFADKLNISRTPVREALRKLEADDLVEYIPRKGIIVKKITIQDIEEIYKIREALEMLVIENVIEKISNEEINELQHVLAVIDQKEENGELNEIIELLNIFNKRLYASSKMPRLYDMISNLNEYIVRFRKISVINDKRRTEVLREHKMILKAILDKDKEKALKINQEHLKQSKKISLQYFNEIT